MRITEVCDLKDKLLADAYKRVRREDFVSEEIYQQYLSGLEDGILNFYSAFMLEVIAEDTRPIKKVG